MIIADIFYYIIKNIGYLLVYSFFKEIKIIGQKNIPKKGPVILCGTHNSQYVDAVMMIAASKRPVNFLIAEKSTRHNILKYLVKFMNVVPVTRPIDKKKEGKGLIKLVDISSCTMKGEGTSFKAQMKMNDTIRIIIKNPILRLPEVFLFRVKEILDDETLKFAPNEELFETLKSSESLKKISETCLEIKYKFSILPKVNQRDVFKGTLDTLEQQKIIGIFPEGGSHDQTQLIEVKPGACIFAYKLFQEKGIECKVIPVGINYFGSHKFRSKVVINVGEPLDMDFKQEDRKDMLGNFITYWWTSYNR